MTAAAYWPVRMNDERASLPGASLILRPVDEADLDALVAILQEPEVAHWWGRYDEGRVRDEFLRLEPDAEVYAIEHDGLLVGAIQLSEETDPDYRHAGIDIFLTSTVRGRGLGPDAIRTAVRYLVDERGHHRVTIDPAADNASAIRAYEKVGFRPVGRMRQYERTGSGAWRDGLLMELLADELVR